VLISSAAARAAAGADGVPPLKPLGEIRLRGRAEAIEVFGLA
jgi:class 3 adenylate cyclase